MDASVGGLPDEVNNTSSGGLVTGTAMDRQVMSLLLRIDQNLQDASSVIQNGYPAPQPGKFLKF